MENIAPWKIILLRMLSLNTSKRLNGRKYIRETLSLILLLLGTINMPCIIFLEYFTLLFRAKILGHFGMIGKYVRDFREQYPPYIFYLFLVLVALIPIFFAFYLNREGDDTKKTKRKSKKKPDGLEKQD